MVSVGVRLDGALSSGDPSGSEVTNAKSDGVNPTVVRRSARVATFTSTMDALSTTLTPTTVRTFRSLPTGAKNQKLSVKPSPSVSQKVRETTLRGVISTHSSLFETPWASGFSVRPFKPTPNGSSNLIKFGSVSISDGPVTCKPTPIAF